MIRNPVLQPGRPELLFVPRSSEHRERRQLLLDLDDESAPGVRGPLQVLMLENAPIGEDKIFFKHYGVSSFDKDQI
jgi:hypothetical protein